MESQAEEQREDVEIAKIIIKKYGINAQFAKIGEELNELAIVCMKAVSSGSVDYRSMAEEMADVKFVLLQLMLIMNEQCGQEGFFEDLVNTNYNYKVHRTMDLLNMNNVLKR